LPCRRTPTRILDVSKRILIVDDNPGFRAAAAELLAERGFEFIDEASDGDEASSAVSRTCPDGILLDINLPGRDGFAVATSLASACPQVRIVLTSSEVDRVPAQVVKDCGATMFVPKDQLATARLHELFAR
jgi:DNA-binding NarL/FixJ family response regulator